jgi:hypothetical protein
MQVRTQARRGSGLSDRTEYTAGPAPEGLEKTARGERSEPRDEWHKKMPAPVGAGE